MGINQSDNFRLQLLSKNESAALFSLIESNRNRLEDFFAGTTAQTRTLADTEQYCLKVEQQIQQKEYFPYLIIEISSSQPVGFIDLKNISWDIPKGELGAFIDSSFEGQGLISSFGTSLINQIVSEHKFKKLYCRVAQQNKRSIRLVERIGFTLEGTIRREYKTTKGELVDLNYYGRLFD